MLVCTAMDAEVFRAHTSGTMNARSRKEHNVKALIKASLSPTKVFLQLNIFFYSKEGGILWAYIYFLGGALQLDLFSHFCVCAQMAVSFYCTYLRFCTLRLGLQRPNDW